MHTFILTGNVVTGELFYGWKWHRESIRKFHEAVTTSGANPESLLHLALEHWSHGPIPDTVATLHFGMVVHTLSSLAGGGVSSDFRAFIIIEYCFDLLFYLE